MPRARLEEALLSEYDEADGPARREMFRIAVWGDAHELADHLGVCTECERRHDSGRVCEVWM